MIEKILLNNYRNLRMPEGLTLDPLTILVGPNGSGKTNLIRVLRFLQDAWIASVDERRGVTRFESAIARLGGGRILDRRMETPSIVTLAMYMDMQSGYRHDYILNLWVADENTVSVRREVLQRWPRLTDAKESGIRYRDIDPNKSGIYYYSADRAEKQGMRLFFDQPGGTRLGERDEYIPSINANELVVHSLQQWIEENSKIPSKDLPFFEGKRLVEDFIIEWAFYDAALMNTDAIRNKRPETGPGDRALTESGDNLALVLHNLSRDSIDFEERIQQAMTELFPKTRKLRAVVSGRVSLTVEWYQHGISKPFYLDEMSEGTIRMLCWATILFSPKLPRLIVIEEPEANLHPAWLRVLAGWIRDAARRTQVIVSTHSSDLLDYFTEDIASVRVFEKDPENSLYCRIQALNPESVADKIAEGWRLGDLYRVGDPQIGGWPW